MKRGTEHELPASVGESRLTIGFVAQATLVVIGLWALANMLWLGRELLFLAFFAALVALFLSIFVDRLEKIGFPRAVAAVLVLLAFLGALAGLFWLLWPMLEEQVTLIRRELPASAARAEAWFRSQYRAITGEVGGPNGEMARELQQRLGREAVDVIAGALPLLNTVIGALAGVLIVVFTGVYLAAEPGLYLRGATLLIPPTARGRVREALKAAGSDLRRWLVGTAIGMLTIGVLTTLGLWLLDIPAALALGLIAGILEFIPIFGPILSAIPAMAVALIISPSKVLWVVLLYTAIQQLESNLVVPLVMKGAVELPPALTVLFAALMAILFGFLGLFMAVPLLAAAIALIRQLYVREIEESSS